MIDWKKMFSLCLGVLCLVWGTQENLSAGLFGKRSFNKVFSGSSSDRLQFIEERSNLKINLPEAWNISLPSPVTGPVWFGTTYKEVPYTEAEFNKLRDEKIMAELEKVKQDYIKKVKAEKNKDGDGAAVDDLLSDLLAEGEEKEEEDVSQYLVDFDELAVRRKIASRIFVSQTRYLPIPAIYLTLKNLQVFCIDLNTGITSWVYRLKMPLNTVPFETEENLYIVQAGSCYIIDKQTGLATEKITFDRAVYPILFANQDRLYPVGYGNRVASWSPDRSAANWYYKMAGGVNGGVFGHSEGLLLPLSNGELLSLSFEGDEKWTFISKSHSDEKIFLEKQIADKNKEIENEKKEARRADRKEDINIMSKLEKEIDALMDEVSLLDGRTRGKFLAKPHIYKDSLLIGSTDFNLYRLNRFSGLPEWSYASGASIFEEAFSGGESVYFKDNRARLHKVNFKTGKGGVIQSGVDRILGTKDHLTCYEKDRRVWVDWTKSKGYFEGWDSKDLHVSKDMSLVIGVSSRGKINVWKTDGIRQLPQG